MTDVARTDNYNTWIDETALLPTLTRQDPTERLRAWVELFREVYKASEILAKTAFVPKDMIGKPADVAAAIMKGHELGMDPLDALANIFVIHGRVGMYAEFMRRRIIQAGHSFRVIESTDNRCIVEGVRREGGEPQRASFTVEQARKAGIDLSKYPSDKLVARATSRLCRQVFPDVLSGTLIAEDLIDGLIPTDDEQPTLEAATARPALQRRRQPTKPKAAATQPKTAPKPADDDTEQLLEDQHNETAPLIPPAGTEDRSDEYLELIQDEPPPEPQPAPEPEHVTAPQLKKLWALLRENGFEEKDAALGFLSALLNREVTSIKTGDTPLTKDEASQAIDTLENAPDE